MNLNSIHLNFSLSEWETLKAQSYMVVLVLCIPSDGGRERWEGFSREFGVWMKESREKERKFIQHAMSSLSCFCIWSVFCTVFDSLIIENNHKK